MNTIALNDCYPTVQGEGCLTGTAMVLVRLHGCDVGCPFCDTKETWHFSEEFRVHTIGEAVGTNPRWINTYPEDIATYVHCRYPGPRWILVTGGEPAQQALGPLVESFRKRSYQIALETSGTSRGCLGPEWDWVCVSPKIGMPGNKFVLPDILVIADEIKMVIGKESDLETLQDLLIRYRTKPGVQVCLQPMSRSTKATELCHQTAIKMGWRLSVQTHKMINIR